MAEIRSRRRRPEWPLWLLAAATAGAIWASAALTAADRASWAPGVVWISPAPVVLLAAWWRGVPGAAVAASGVALGGLGHAEIARDAPLDAWMWPVLGVAYASIYGLAALWLRRRDVDLRRSGLLHTGRFVVASVLASLAIGAVGALLASREPAMADRGTTALVLALIDVSTVVVAVPLAFVLRGTRVRRTRRRRTGVATYVASVGFGVGVVLLSSAAGVQIDLLAVGLVVLVLVALAHDRRQRDASARRLAGELAFERARVGSLVASAPDGYLSLDSLGHVEAANRAAAQLFDAPHAALVGRSIIDVLPPPEGSDPAAHLAALLSSTSATSWWHGHDLSGRPIVVSLAVSRIDAGEQWGYGVVVRSAADQARPERARTDRVTHDETTGLPNRLLFEDRLASALESQRRRPTGLAVLLVDVEVTATEEALASVLRDCVRQSDTVARLDVTRFAVLCRPCPNLGSATAVATRIVDAVRPIGSATIGIAMAFDASMRPDTLLSVAGTALVEAATIGDHQFRVADSSTDGSGNGGTDIDLRDGVLADRLVLRYQPILDLASGDVTAVEALTRLRADDGVLVVPADIVTTVEDAGSVDELGAAVIRQAMLDLVVVRSEEGAGEIRVTVNVSPNQLTKGDLPAIVRRALEEAALPAHALVLEITETTPLDTMPEAVEVLRALYAIGVGIALDDFGTGFTRLDLIQDLPLDAVKIDRTFVHRFLDNAIDRDIIEMIVALAQRRGLTVIAEGVETVEQADLLARVGCSHAQGFLFGQPVDVDELRYLLREWQIVPAIATSRSLKRFAP